MCMRKRQQRRIAREVISFMQDILRTAFPLNIGVTGTYEDEDIYTACIEAAFETTSVEDISLRHREIKEQKYPSGDIVLYHIKNKLTTEKILVGFRYGTRRILTRAKRNGYLKGKVQLGLDRSKDEYYGKLRNENIVRGEHKNGTTFFFEYSTIDILSSSPRFTLELVPHTMFVGGKDMPFLIESANALTDTELHFFDRGIRSVEWFEYLKDTDAPYVTPMVMNDSTDKFVEGKYWEGEHVFQYEMKSGKRNISLTTFVYQNQKWDQNEWLQQGKKYKVKRFLAFHTDLPYEVYFIDEKKHFRFITPAGRKLSLIELGNEYRTRWGVETDYKVDKRELFALTTSNNYVIRLFFFCLAILLRNCWELFVCLYRDVLNNVSGFFSMKLWKFTLLCWMNHNLHPNLRSQEYVTIS